ncbi:hypothetical protein QW180_20955 [Vibrio sinaloensis]|nr:hypothetical protein [Vibrio sinaloensis]
MPLRRSCKSLKKQALTIRRNITLGGDLGDWQSQFEQTVDGVIPMTISFGASEFDKRLDLTWLGYVADDWNSAKQIYGLQGGMLNIYNDIFADIGLHALGIVPTGFGSMAIRKGVGKVPVEFPEDTKGLKNSYGRCASSG